jgi:hypothetical protein
MLQDEINLNRLLLICENKLQQSPIETWTDSDKRKFATVSKDEIESKYIYLYISLFL